MSVLMFVTLTEIFLGVWNRPPASLGELARREAVRRQTVPASVRSLTDLDLGPPPTRSPRTGQARPAATVGRDNPGQKPEAAPVAASVQRDEAWWRERMAQARSALERDTLLVKALESRVAALTRDVVNRDDPAQRTVLVAERLRALEQLDLMEKQVTADAEAIKAIEDEARREGVPPGWIRIDLDGTVTLLTVSHAGSTGGAETQRNRTEGLAWTAALAAVRRPHARPSHDLRDHTTA